MTTAAQKAACRELTEAELDDISGGTSAFMHAVDHAIQKSLWENNCNTIKGGDGTHTECLGPV